MCVLSRLIRKCNSRWRGCCRDRNEISGRVYFVVDFLDVRWRWGIYGVRDVRIEVEVVMEGLGIISSSTDNICRSVIGLCLDSDPPAISGRPTVHSVSKLRLRVQKCILSFGTRIYVILLVVALVVPKIRVQVVIYPLKRDKKNMISSNIDAIEAEKASEMDRLLFILRTWRRVDRFCIFRFTWESRLSRERFGRLFFFLFAIDSY